MTNYYILEQRLWQIELFMITIINNNISSGWDM